MKAAYSSSELGQSMALISLVLLAILAALALSLDGTLVYVARDKAERAAQAGIRAGTDELCRGSTAEVAEATAVLHAVNGEEHLAATAVADTEADALSVRVTLTYHTTFFALLGQPTGQASAEARAGCEQMYAAP
jgi:hypothetical protein